MKKILIMAMLVSGLFAEVNFFPVINPVMIGKQILCTGWSGYKRPDMNGKNYMALNYPCLEGAELAACQDGVVSYTAASAQGRRFEGAVIEIQYNNGRTGVYCHLSNWNVRKGDTVKRGDIVAYAGRTGRTSGTHLRYYEYDTKTCKRLYLTSKDFGLPLEAFMYRAEMCGEFSYL